VGCPQKDRIFPKSAEKVWMGLLFQLLDNLRRRWRFGYEGQLEMADDFIYDFMILDEGHNFHFSPA